MIESDSAAFATPLPSFPVFPWAQPWWRLHRKKLSKKPKNPESLSLDECTLKPSLRDSLLHLPCCVNRESCTSTHSLVFSNVKLTLALKHPTKRFKTWSILTFNSQMYVFDWWKMGVVFVEETKVRPLVSGLQGVAIEMGFSGWPLVEWAFFNRLTMR